MTMQIFTLILWKMKAAERNFIRFTRSSIIVYQPVVRELALADLQLVHVGTHPDKDGKWNWYIAFFSNDSSHFPWERGGGAPRWLHQVNPQAETLYAYNWTALTGDFTISKDVATFNDLLYFKLNKYEDAKQ
jgi:hypothetical protein